MRIKCCLGCEPPKRHPGCHGTCPDYKKERAEYDAEREAYMKIAKAENDAKAYTVRHMDKLRREKKRKNR